MRSPRRGRVLGPGGVDDDSIIEVVGEVGDCLSQRAEFVRGLGGVQPSQTLAG